MICSNLTHAQIGYWTQIDLPWWIPCLFDMQMYDSQFGMAVGRTVVPGGGTDYAGIIITTDGGLTWNPVPNRPPVFDPKMDTWTVWRAVCIIDRNTAVVAGDSARIYKTLDGGATWFQAISVAQPAKWASKGTIRGVFFQRQYERRSGGR